MDVGKLHVVIVHFPIALSLSALLADIVWIAARKEFFRSAGMYCLLLAALSVIPVAFTGDQLLDSMQQGLSGDTLSMAQTHKTLALISLTLIILAVIVRIYRQNNLQKGWLGFYFGLMVLIGGFISATGHYGGMLAFGKDYLSGLF
jgi:uncharacterized membrane protein